MDIVQLMSFVLVATLLVVSPGPNGLLIAKTVPISGKSAGFANVAGFVMAFYVHGALSILGISILLVQSAQAFFLFKMLGAAYLCWIGVKSILAAWKNDTAPVVQAEITPGQRKTPLHGAILEGFLTNVLNPKVSMFYLAAFPQFMPAGGEVFSGFMLVTVHSLLNLLWFSAMVLLLAKVRNVASGETFTRWLKSITGAVFIGFAVKLALLKPASNA